MTALELASLDELEPRTEFIVNTLAYESPRVGVAHASPQEIHHALHNLALAH